MKRIWLAGTMIAAAAALSGCATGLTPVIHSSKYLSDESGLMRVDVDRSYAHGDLMGDRERIRTHIVKGIDRVDEQGVLVANTDIRVSSSLDDRTYKINTKEGVNGMTCVLNQEYDYGKPVQTAAYDPQTNLLYVLTQQNVRLCTVGMSSQRPAIMKDHGYRVTANDLYLVTDPLVKQWLKAMYEKPEVFEPMVGSPKPEQEKAVEALVPTADLMKKLEKEPRAAMWQAFIRKGLGLYNDAWEDEVGKKELPAIPTQFAVTTGYEWLLSLVDLTPNPKLALRITDNKDKKARAVVEAVTASSRYWTAEGEQRRVEYTPDDRELKGIALQLEFSRNAEKFGTDVAFQKWNDGYRKLAQEQFNQANGLYGEGLRLVPTTRDFGKKKVLATAMASLRTPEVFDALAVLKGEKAATEPSKKSNVSKVTSGPKKDMIVQVENFNLDKKTASFKPIEKLGTLSTQQLGIVEAKRLEGKELPLDDGTVEMIREGLYNKNTNLVVTVADDQVVKSVPVFYPLKTGHKSFWSGRPELTAYYAPIKEASLRQDPGVYLFLGNLERIDFSHKSPRGVNPNDFWATVTVRMKQSGQSLKFFAAGKTAQLLHFHAEGGNLHSGSRIGFQIEYAGADAKYIYGIVNIDSGIPL